MKPLLDQFAADGSFWKTTEPLELRVVDSEDIERFNELLARKHYLGETPPVGDFLRQVGGAGRQVGGAAGVGACRSQTQRS